MQTTYFQRVKKINRLAIQFIGLCLLLLVIPTIASAQRGGSGGRGTPGDTFLYYIVYTPETCPLPAAVKADYTSISFCGLGKRSNKSAGDFLLRVDGFTMLTPIVRNVDINTPITLPCGNVVFISRFTETAFAQTSPEPPPYRLFTESNKIVDTCQ